MIELNAVFPAEEFKKGLAQYMAEAIEEKVHHPLHYNTLPAECAECGHPIECIDVVQHLNFNRGNAIKYIWRAGSKSPGNLAAEIEDLKKTRQYVDFEIERLEKLLKERSENAR